MTFLVPPARLTPIRFSSIVIVYNHGPICPMYNWYNEWNCIIQITNHKNVKFCPHCFTIFITNSNEFLSSSFHLNRICFASRYAFQGSIQREMKWNESGFRPPLCTYRLNWARRTSWGWWDESDETVFQTKDSKSSPDGLRPSTLLLGHGGSPQYWLLHVDGEETFLFLSNRRDREPNPEL